MSTHYGLIRENRLTESTKQREVKICKFSGDLTEEEKRLFDEDERVKNWKRWGPYLSERQWSTVREDYSDNSDSWNYFPHDHARKRTYRWGEDGLLGITDRECRLAFSYALWNGKDPILKERLYGLTGNEGNHGEDVKELYYYLDSTPTHSYMKALYKYPQDEYPYTELVDENRRRSRSEREYELYDTGTFQNGRYFDIFAEYAKADDNDMLIRVHVVNNSTEAADITVLPQFWLRNTWSWGTDSEEYYAKGSISTSDIENNISIVHGTLGDFCFAAREAPDEWIFTENETNFESLYGGINESPYTKDGFHNYIINGDQNAIHRHTGTKAGGVYKLHLLGGETKILDFRLWEPHGTEEDPFDLFDEEFDTRKEEADQFFDKILGDISPDQKMIARQSFAGLLWSKQYYHYVINDWLRGDPNFPEPPRSRYQGRNSQWTNLHNRDIISMPDKWEYPWYASWDLAFHMVSFVHVDPFFAKSQLVLFLREWYMHPNGMLPAYEFNFSDVNPPVHAWAVWKVYKMDGMKDKNFLLRCFLKLILNFTWWINRKDESGNNIFAGGFLGLDNISIFDRSQAENLQQADATSWMAFFCSCMLNMALELALDIPAMEDIASKFFEHFIAIVDSMNHFQGTGLWDEEDGFYYDQINDGGDIKRLKLRSMVGLLPLCAVNVIKEDKLSKLPGFQKRMDWFLEYKSDLSRHISYCCKRNPEGEGGKCFYLLALPSEEKLRRVLTYMLDESEFLSPYGIRSLSKHYADNPYDLDGNVVSYLPGESDNGMFGGNSNWRGPIWFPINTLIIESLRKYHKYYGNEFKIECPTGSGNLMNLLEVSIFLSERLVDLFVPDENGTRPSHSENIPEYKQGETWEELILFYEYFNSDTGEGLGASHQTGWTSLVSHLILSINRLKQ